MSSSFCMLPDLHTVRTGHGTNQTSAQFSRSVVSNFLRPHESQHARPPCPSPTPEFTETSIKSVMPSSHLILCCPLLLLPPIPPSIRIFSNESALCMRWPKYWSFTFSIIPSKEIPGLLVKKKNNNKKNKKQTGSKQEKEYIKAVYCPSAYLTYMQSTS